MMDLVVFEVAGRRYALPLPGVHEVVRAVAVRPLPKAPPIVEGVIDVHGILVPVLDIRTRFRLPPKPLEPSDHLVLAAAGPRLVAIRADRALDLVVVAEGDVADASAVVPSAEYVAGVAALADGLVVIADLETFLAAAEADALDEALSSAALGGVQ